MFKKTIIALLIVARIVSLAPAAHADELFGHWSADNKAVQYQNEATTVSVSDTYFNGNKAVSVETATELGEKDGIEVNTTRSLDGTGDVETMWKHTFNDDLSFTQWVTYEDQSEDNWKDISISSSSTVEFKDVSVNYTKYYVNDEETGKIVNNYNTITPAYTYSDDETGNEFHVEVEHGIEDGFNQPRVSFTYNF